VYFFDFFAFAVKKFFDPPVSGTFFILALALFAERWYCRDIPPHGGIILGKMRKRKRIGDYARNCG
jgi:hypothetical protein